MKVMVTIRRVLGVLGCIIAIAAFVLGGVFMLPNTVGLSSVLGSNGAFWSIGVLVIVLITGMVVRTIKTEVAQKVGLALVIGSMAVVLTVALYAMGIYNNVTSAMSTTTLGFDVTLAFIGCAVYAISWLLFALEKVYASKK